MLIGSGIVSKPIFAMINEQMYRKIILKPQKDRSVLNFHPWVFSGAIQTDVKSFTDGELVDVYNHAGNYLATGHFRHGTIMVRIISFKKQTIDAAFWKEKFRQALALRKMLGLIKNPEINAFRLIHGEGDGLPGLIIDIYDDVAVVQTHSEGMHLAIDDISAELQQLEDLQINTVYDKSSETLSKKGMPPIANSFLAGTKTNQIVTENGVKFYVNWEEGQKTGFFLDQRMNRQLLATYAKGKRVLNTFCYSGGFSMYALQAGAAHVDSVDSSKKAIDWISQNVELNGFDAGKHSAWCEDVFDFLGKNDAVHDIIVLDPPAFAKHLSSVDRATIGYRNLNQEAIRRIKPGGLIFTFSCSQAIDKSLFRKIVFMAAAKTGRNVTILHQMTQGPDHPVSLYHPEGEYLKGLVLRVD